MHPSVEYALVWCVAAGGVLLLTPLARVLAQRWGAIARPRERDVHAFAIPRLGGVAIYAGPFRHRAAISAPGQGRKQSLPNCSSPAPSTSSALASTSRR